MRRANSLTRLAPFRSSRALLPAGIITTLAIFLLVGAVLLVGRQDTAREAEQAADNVAAAMAQDIARNVELYDLSLQAVVHGLQFPGIGTLDPDLRQMILFDRAANARHLGFINVLNETGEVTADSRSKTPRAGNFAGRDYFQFHRREPRDQLYIGRPFLTGPDQPATIPLSRRLSHPDGSFAGVVVGTMRLAYFHELFARVALGPHATIALLRDDGVLLMRLPFSQDDLGRTVPPTSAYFQSINTRMSRFDGTEPGDPTPRTYTLRRVGDLPLVVSVGLADEDVFVPWLHEAILVMATVTALCLLLVGVIARLGIALNRQARAEDRARAANQEMERFVETISHELRTPLTSILGYAELLSWYGKLSADHAGYAAAIVSAGNHMRHVLRRMLEVPRQAMPLSPPDLRDTDLDRLASDCCQEVELSAGRKGLRLGCHVAPELPRSGVMDPVQLRQVLVNLLTNAIKYTAEGYVELRVSRVQGRFRFEVVDTGPGVPPGKVARLFTAHDRLDAEQGHIEGSGLGLWTVETLVIGMDGKVGYSDNPGGGSIFWVEIPGHARVSAPTPAPSPSAAPPSATPAWAGPAPATPPSATPDVAPAPGTPPPLRILVADDTALNRDVAGRFLRSAGHSVVEVCGGAEAVQQVQEEDFDLVLMDIRMPQLNGLEAARQIRALDEPRGRVPIVAVTANSTPSHQDTYHKAGIDRHLRKPFTCEELLRTVEAAVTGSSQPPVAAAAPRQPKPVRERRHQPVIDVEVLEDLTSRMSSDNIQAYLRTLAGRIDDLLALLEAPETAALAELVHEMQGSAGFLGFAALGTALHDYEAADPTALDEQRLRLAALSAAAERSRAALEQRLAAWGTASMGAAVP